METILSVIVALVVIVVGLNAPFIAIATGVGLSKWLGKKR